MIFAERDFSLNLYLKYSEGMSYEHTYDEKLETQ